MKCYKFKTGDTVVLDNNIRFMFANYTQKLVEMANTPLNEQWYSTMLFLFSTHKKNPPTIFNLKNLDLKLFDYVYTISFLPNKIEFYNDCYVELVNLTTHASLIVPIDMIAPLNVTERSNNHCYGFCTNQYKKYTNPFNTKQVADGIAPYTPVLIRKHNSIVKGCWVRVHFHGYDPSNIAHFTTEINQIPIDFTIAANISQYDVEVVKYIDYPHLEGTSQDPMKHGDAVAVKFPGEDTTKIRVYARCDKNADGSISHYVYDEDNKDTAVLVESCVSITTDYNNKINKNNFEAVRNGYPGSGNWWNSSH